MLKNFSMTRVFLKWIPTALVITLISGLIYLAVQQSIRSSANDPQIQIAQDTAVTLKSGSLTLDPSLASNVDIASSLAPYVVVYDSNYNVINSTGVLDGHPPVPPTGVFEAAKSTGRDIITWQPKSGVRSAIVVVSYSSGGNSGYVLAGRSLTEVEVREGNLFIQVFAGWLFTIVASFVSIAFVSYLLRKSYTNH